MTRPLTPKQIAFIDEYMKDRNATQAYIRAGYSRNGAQQSSSRLLRNAVVRAEIGRRIAAHSRTAGVDVVDALRALNAIALADIGSYFDEDGNLLHPRQWSPEAAAALARVTVREVPDERTGKRISKETEIVLQDKPKAIFQLLKLLGPPRADSSAK